MTNFINSLFNPILQFLDIIINTLGNLGSVAAKGIRLDDYLSFFTLLGSSWTGVISSLIASLVFLLVLYMIQKYSRSLLWLKDLIKFW